MIPQQTVIVTGGNNGLGYECARNLALDGNWHIIIASRSAERTESAVRRLHEETGFTHIDSMPLDLASLRSIRAFAAGFAAQSYAPLRALVCNAGVQVMNGTQYTEDGFEMTFGVNHLGHFLLVNLLLSEMTSPARIVVVSSGTHDPDTLDGRIMPPEFTSAAELAYPKESASADGDRNYRTGMRRYVTSKLCNMFFAYELHRRLHRAGATGITVNAYDPGAVPGTGLTREYGSGLAFGIRAMTMLRPVLERVGMNVHTVQSSGAAMARLVTDDGLEGVSGKYFQWRYEKKSSRESYDTAKAAQLWADSVEQLGLRPEDMPVLTASALV